MSLQVRRAADPRTGPVRELALFRNLRHGLAAQDWLCFRHNHYSNRPTFPLRSKSYPPRCPRYSSPRVAAQRSGRFVSPFRLGSEAKSQFRATPIESTKNWVRSFILPYPGRHWPPMVRSPARGWPSRRRPPFSPPGWPAPRTCFGFQAASVPTSLLQFPTARSDFPSAVPTH
jgi:hypothetical protein